MNSAVMAKIHSRSIKGYHRAGEGSDHGTQDPIGLIQKSDTEIELLLVNIVGGFSAAEQ